jgi:hypothetical protein
MSRKDVERIYELRNRHTRLLADREAAIKLGQQHKAEFCRIKATEIARKLYIDFDLKV